MNEAAEREQRELKQIKAEEQYELAQLDKRRGEPDFERCRRIVRAKYARRRDCIQAQYRAIRCLEAPDLSQRSRRRSKRELDRTPLV